MINPLHICRICGLDNGYPVWEDEETPTYDICLCCGCEFGYDDYDLEVIKEYREKWLKFPKWSYPEYQTKNWDLDSQLSQIPKEFL